MEDSVVQAIGCTWVVLGDPFNGAGKFLACPLGQDRRVGHAWRHLASLISAAISA